MIVPEFWSEARIQKRFPDRQITVKRFGWSDESQEAADLHAQGRVEEAFDRIVNGEQLTRRERKVRYNGEDGLPIREEILERLNDNVITRNSYGARCLNSPNVLFADVDFPPRQYNHFTTGCLGFVLACPIFVLVGQLTGNQFLSYAVLVLLTILGYCAAEIGPLLTKLKGGKEKVTLERVKSVLASYPDWHVRIYRSPNGFRLLAMHQTFDPRSLEVETFFDRLKVDPTYKIMCQKQNCFRARLTAKPWRIGINQRLKPRPGVWPLNPIHMPNRAVWVAEYESMASNFSACRLEFVHGPADKETPEASVVQVYHDRVCNAETNYELG